jgi:Nucleotidyl transferase AbiEii toxin, Type IV TA system
VIEVIRAASEVQAVCEGESWRFCFIGGLALQRWGEPRETVDVDLTLLTGFGGEEPFIAQLLQKFQSRIANAAEFARAHRVLLLRSSAGVGIDRWALFLLKNP